MAAIFGLCLKADKLLKIVYGDRVAWEGQATDQEITVDQGGPFRRQQHGRIGRIERLGPSPAWASPVSAAEPGHAQMPSGEDVYAHRGLVTPSMDKSYVASFSPQFRTLRCLVRHTAYDWYPDKAVIAGTQINPAHEIRDALINPDLGGQYTADDLDDASFRQAADILYAENFGLSPSLERHGQDGNLYTEPSRLYRRHPHPRPRHRQDTPAPAARRLRRGQPSGHRAGGSSPP